MHSRSERLRATGGIVLLVGLLAVSVAAAGDRLAEPALRRAAEGILLLGWVVFAPLYLFVAAWAADRERREADADPADRGREFDEK